MTSIVRQFVAVYGADAYERLAVRADSSESLAAVLLRALEGPSAVPKECNEMFSKDTPTQGAAVKSLSHIVVKWKHPDSPNESHALYDAMVLGELVAKQRAESKVVTVQASGHVVTKYMAYYTDGTTANLAMRLG